MHTLIQEEIQKLAAVLIKIQNNEALLQSVDTIAQQLVLALQHGNKILFAGNGGSAADAQHLAAELVGRLCYHRPALPAIALTTDTSALTAIGNDYSIEYIFSRQVEALGQAGDVLVGISTSGKSPNILRALELARERKMITVGFTGANGHKMTEKCDFVLTVPSCDTQKIQECHIMFGHIICGIVEDQLFGDQYNPLRVQEGVCVK